MSIRSLRSHTAQMIEFNTEARLASRIVDIALISLILTNVLAIILESVASIAKEYQAEFYYFELFSIAVFSVEYLLRVWACPELDNPKYSNNWQGRIRYIFSLTALIDLAAILPFYLSFFMAIDLRFLRVFRIFRVLKLTRYSSAMNILLLVLKQEANAFFAAFFLLGMVLILASCGIYLIEQDIQPEAFGSIPAAMWWATATLTTVGFGDVTPITPLGKLFGGIIMIVGIAMVALPAGILAAGFSEQLKRNKAIYKDRVARAYDDGILNKEERLALESLRAELGINQQDAMVLISSYREKMINHLETCPHCLKALITEKEPPKHASEDQ